MAIAEINIEQGLLTMMIKDIDAIAIWRYSRQC